MRGRIRIALDSYAVFLLRRSIPSETIIGRYARITLSSTLKNPSEISLCAKSI